LNQLIGQVRQVFGAVPTGRYGAATSMDFIFEGTARSQDNVSLSISGLVAYLYYQAYGTRIPNIFATPRPPITDLERTQIYSVYDAINVPRPL